MPDFGRWNNNGGDPSLNEVNRTDRFLDALASEQPVYSTDSGEAELAYLLAGWRDEVRHTPATAVVTTRDAVQALDRSAASRRRRRVSMAVLGSVAAGVIAVGGLGGVIAGAGPDDPLYGLRTALFGAPTQTRDDQIMLAAQSQLAEVQQLIDQGDWETAQTRLQTMTTTVAAVDDTARQQELVDQWQQLQVKVETRDVNATVPPDAPPVVLPEVPPDLPLPVLLDPNATSPAASTSPSSSTTPGTSVPVELPPTTPPVPGEPTPGEPTPGQPTTSGSSPTSTQPSPTPTSQPSPTPTAQPTPTAVPTSTVQPSSTRQPTPPPATTAPATTAPPSTRPTPPTTTTVVLPAPADEPQAEAPVVEQPQVEPEQPRLSGGSPGSGRGSAPNTTLPVIEVPGALLPEAATPDGGE